MKLNAKPSDLLAILKTNRDGHEAIYKAAMVKYLEAQKELNNFRDSIQAGIDVLDRKYKGMASNIQFYWNLPRPEKHLKDYDRVIRIMELEQSVTIELSEQEVAMYVQNEWAWSQAFSTSTASYLVTKADSEEQEPTDG